ncbi:MAG: aldehyde dehydrogenase family protein [Candidatus Rokubacteria bacterium]|nr:aldehyde dehydrogenase family protein [Candidatus Rokubacteria bacterium]
MSFPVSGDRRQVLVNGQWREGRGGRPIDVFNPSTNEVLFAIIPASREDVHEAVDAAWSAYREGPWGRMPGLEKGFLITRLATLMQERVEILAELEARNTGIPIRQSRFEVVSAARHLEYFAGFAGKIEGAATMLSNDRLMYTLREPLGVVGQCVPWNTPLKLMARGCAAALACGNTLVIKPSVVACASVLYFGTLVEEAGIPNGVVNIVPGPGSMTGTALVEHPDVRKIVFTGGTEGGAQVLAAAGRNVVPALVELGGKGPIIVCGDADLDEAADGVMSQAFARQGEVCFAGTRLFLPAAIHDNFVARLVKRADAMVVGDAMDEATEMPTLVTGVKQGMKIAQDEVFGPVLAVHRYTELGQAVREANATEFGLAGYVWTRDVRQAHRLAASMECGNVFINTYRYSSEVPFGGFKKSGIGREHGQEALREYTQVKTVVIGLDRWVETDALGRTTGEG